jgi:hypothetical protein
MQNALDIDIDLRICYSLEFSLRVFCLRLRWLWKKTDRVGLETALPPSFGKEIINE